MASCQLQREHLPETTRRRLQHLPFGNRGSTLLCDISTGTPRSVVPASWRKRVFEAVHNLTHPGMRATHHLMAGKFVRPGMNKKVSEWAKSCIQC